jgi:hypothetical protein
MLKKCGERRKVRQMSETARNLATRLKSPLKDKVANFEATTGVEGTTLVTNLLEAAMDYFAEHGSITFPLVVVPKSQWLSSQTAQKSIMATSALLSEPTQSYSTKPKKKAS